MKVVFIPFSMHGCPSLLQPYLEGEGINKKSKSWKTTSFGRSIMGNQHCNGRYDHLGSVASFVQNQRLAYKLSRYYWSFSVTWSGLAMRSSRNGGGHLSPPVHQRTNGGGSAPYCSSSDDEAGQMLGRKDNHNNSNNSQHQTSSKQSKRKKGSGGQSSSLSSSSNKGSSSTGVVVVKNCTDLPWLSTP